eukprot:gene17132-53730_t
MSQLDFPDGHSHSVLSASGCNSGGADLGLWWVEDNGLCSEADYAYTSGTTGKKGTCR